MIAAYFFGSPCTHIHTGWLTKESHYKVSSLNRIKKRP